MDRFAPPTGNRGVALVITLILLAVITTLAIAFLALTYRETVLVDQMGRTTDAELAADSALERAKAEILSPFPPRNKAPNVNGSEIMGPDFLVSINSTLLDDTNRLDPTNMFFNPSPPVFVETNRGNTAGPLDERFYLDLNRNGYFEETGFVPDTTNQRDAAGKFQKVVGPDGKDVLNWRVGDPQFIGILQRPGEPHGPNNRFIARYAYIVLPVGRSLDVNWMHNQALNLEMRENIGFNGFFRNQGVGTWELNLAGFLADLNTNYWGKLVDYGFYPLNYLPFDPSKHEPLAATGIALGVAFDDARELLRYRYSPWTYKGTAWDLSIPLDSAHFSNDTVNVLYPGLAGDFEFDSVDRYSNGPLGPLKYGDPPPVDPARTDPRSDNPNQPWPGADSRRHYSSVHDFFDATKLPETGPGLVGFRKKLEDASSLGNSYDRYTYYRMLAQLGTDSVPEEDGKIDINYMNIRSWKTGEQILASDAIPWTSSNVVYVPRLGKDVDMGRPGPELFFLTVVTNLLVREPELAFIVTNARPFSARNDPFGIPLRIPIYTNGSSVTTNLPVPGPLYSGRLHQILQQAANIYDATREGIYPTVFRPQFDDPNPPNGDVYITNYVRIEFYNQVSQKDWHDLDVKEPSSDPTAVRIKSRPVQRDDLVYGIPFIVGARKGFPNFNELAVRTTAEATRRLDFYRANAGAAIVTNQTLTLNVANEIAVEARNSYLRPFDRPLDMYFGIRTRTVITNNSTVFPSSNWITGYATSIVARSWGGTRAGEAEQFRVSTLLHQPVLNYTNVSELDQGGVTNQWGLSLTNRMLFFLVEPGNDRIVDAVTLNGPRNYFDIAGEMGSELKGKEGRALGNIWSVLKDPNRGTSFGITHQITVSRSPGETSDREWTDYNAENKSKQESINNLVNFLNGTGATNHMQAGFTPIRRMLQTNYFRVNDPLVHYTMEDLEANRAVATLSPELFGTNFPPLSLGTPNPNSTPWGKGGTSASSAGAGALDPALLDPGVSSSESWDFPTNQFPSIGWLGRVHRGTPWQTIYLKSKAVGNSDWHKHSGLSRYQESANLMHPTRDWRLLDIFTTAPHPNATRGRLSINQTNEAAWSAVLSGVVVNKAVNDPDWGVVTALNSNVVVTPSAPLLDNGLSTVIAGINFTRTNRPNAPPYAQFTRLGDLLATPELTFKSPFLNSSEFDADAPGLQDQVFDYDYERIPQQILSLLKVGEPRFVVYAWGQSLKPARTGSGGTGPSIDTGGDWRGLCRNYQISGELAVRAVVRVDFERDPANGLTDYRKPHAVVESYSIVPVE